ncbi:MAG: thymidine phosphorylase [Planctomycetota bacterium]|jgi:pyrimidine-nucleoside phosphorylase|nr:thymidine phosphorylase [Planctomycetota bacterium]
MIPEWLAQRRDGVEQGPEQIFGFIEAVTSGEVSQAQIGAWLAFVIANGMSERETVLLTKAMVDSGTCLSWPGIDGPFVDKHSTGGIGDKVSLVLAPLWVAMGKKVPMLSGRGLGITGGTLDKLESIPGYNTNLTNDQLADVLGKVGCFINGQTAELAPADRILYAMRNETQTVPSIPLITASILSKKLVEGIGSLIMDVKFGSGAFMKSREQAQALADSIVNIGNSSGLDTRAILSDMSQPLGNAVGNSLEVVEAEACLSGSGPSDLIELVCDLSGDAESARTILHDGTALDIWHQMVAAHGGDRSVPLQGSTNIEQVDYCAEHSGVLNRCDAQQIGMAAFVLGAGREVATQEINHGVGVIVHAKVGDSVDSGQPLLSVYHNHTRLDSALAHIEAAFEVE